MNAFVYLFMSRQMHRQIFNFALVHLYSGLVIINNNNKNLWNNPCRVFEFQQQNNPWDIL